MQLAKPYSINDRAPVALPRPARVYLVPTPGPVAIAARAEFSEADYVEAACNHAGACLDLLDAEIRKGARGDVDSARRSAAEAMNGLADARDREMATDAENERADELEWLWGSLQTKATRLAARLARKAVAL